MRPGPIPGRSGSASARRVAAFPGHRCQRLALPLIGALWVGLSVSVAHAHQPLDVDIARAAERIATSTAPARELLLRGEKHRLAGDFAAARVDYDAAAALDPHLAGLELCRAALLVDESRWNEALAALDHVIEHEPKEPRAWELRARALEALARPGEAADALAGAIASGNRSGPDLYIERARLLEQAGRSSEAILTLDQGLRRLGPIVVLDLAAADLETRMGRARAAKARRDRVATQIADVRAARAARGDWPEPEAPTSVSVPAVPNADPLVTRGPYLQIGTPTSMTIRWRTDVAATSRVNFGTSLGSLTQSESEATLTTEHEITLTGLSPDTRHYYAVGTTTLVLVGGDNDHTFTTAPVPGTPKPTRIWVVGDPGTGSSDQTRVRDAYVTYTGTRPTDVWLMLGDNAYDSGTDSEYQRGCFTPYRSQLRSTVLWPTRGNHDELHSGVNNDYYDLFTMPAAGEAGGLASGSEAFYSFDHGNIHFICLDSEGTTRTPTGAMATWLRNDIAATTRDWVIAYWHHPPYTKGSHDSDNDSDSGGRMGDMREVIVPILEAEGVDLVLTGHSHSYERSFLIDGHYGVSSTFNSTMKVDGGDGREDGDGAYDKATLGTAAHEGAVYTVAGSSGKLGGGSLNHPAKFYSVKALGSMVVDVQGNRLDAVFLDDRGAVRDRFTMLKGSGNGPDTTPPAAINDLTIEGSGPMGPHE